MTKTERLEVALRELYETVSPIIGIVRLGDCPSFMEDTKRLRSLKTMADKTVPAFDAARAALAALADTAPSCCEETRESAPVLPCWYCNGRDGEGAEYDPKVHIKWDCEACDERRTMRIKREAAIAAHDAEVRRATLEEARRVVAGHFQICDAARPISMHCVETLSKDIRALSNQAPQTSQTPDLRSPEAQRTLAMWREAKAAGCVLPNGHHGMHQFSVARSATVSSHEPCEQNAGPMGQMPDTDPTKGGP